MDKPALAIAAALLVACTAVDNGRDDIDAGAQAVSAPTARSLVFPGLDGGAVRLANTTPAPVPLTFTLNGQRLYQSTADVLQDVLAGPATQPLEERTWRLVMAESFHFTPLTGAVWNHDPAYFLNSIGFGFCDDVASVEALLWLGLGRQARTWWMNGHVIPELQVGGAWQVWDPDLRARYLTRDRRVASYADLSADPTLMTNPVDKIAGASVYAFDPYYAATYATTADNRTEPPYADPTDQTLTLPPGAEFVFPGHFAPAPAGNDGRAVPTWANARLELPAGFSGGVHLPLVLWAAMGTGTVAGMTIGDPATDAALAVPTKRMVDVQVAASSAVQLVFLMNPKRFALRPDVNVLTWGPTGIAGAIVAAP